MVASKKVVLTDRLLKAMKPAPAGKRTMVWDAIQPHLGVRVSDRGQCSFVVVKRRAGDHKPTRHFLGSYPALSLADARTNTPGILTALMTGADPKELEREKIAKIRSKQSELFQVVADDYINRHVSKLKSKRSTTLIIKRELLGLRLRRYRVDGKWRDEWLPGPDLRWREMRAAKITRRDAVELFEKIADGSRYQARKVFAIVSKMFKWAILRDIYGIENNPISNITHTDILGSFNARARVLSDSELQWVWAAADATSYPFGPLVKMLLLNGQRLREMSAARWSEIDDGVLVVPAERMKGKIPHSVPLVGRQLLILSSIPQYQVESGNSNDSYLFTTTNGRRPVSGFSKMKKRLDLLIETMRKTNGEIGAPMSRWTLHDLRRTVRTRLSSLGVQPLVAELIIGHKQTGIHAVYDLHSYDAEKRAALSSWQASLDFIIGKIDASTHQVKTGPLRQAA